MGGEGEFETGAKWADLCSFAQGEETERERTSSVVGNYLQQEFAVVRSLGEMSIRLRTAAAVKPCDKESAAIKTASAAAAAKRGGEGREGLDLAGGEADDAVAAGQ